MVYFNNPVREVGSILRYLGIFPTQEQLAELIKQMRQDEPSEYITFKNFCQTATNLLVNKQMLASETDALLKAFKRIDVESKGFLLPNELRQLMQGMPEPLSDQEVNEMLAVSSSNLGLHGPCRPKNLL